jgi:predicted O-methyltransferase YrrM
MPEQTPFPIQGVSAAKRGAFVGVESTELQVEVTPGPPPPAKPPSRFSRELAAVRIVLITVAVTLAAVYFWPWRSPLPAVQVAPDGPRDAWVWKSRDMEFNLGEDWFSYNVPIWEKVLAPFKGKPNVHYLEIGIWEGRSACWMLENILTDPSARLTAIDPFWTSKGFVTDEDLKAKCLRNLERAGGKDKSTLLVGISQDKLRTLPLRSFDIIYIDGSHASWDILEDAILSWRLLKPNGILIFDDYRLTMPTEDKRQPRHGIDTFYRFYGQNFEVLHNAYQAIFKKRPNATDIE